MDKESNTRFALFDHVPCSTEVHLQLLTPSSPIRLRTHLIGIQAKRAVILEWGTDKHWLAANPYLKEDRSVIVRLVNSGDPSGQVFAFRSSISRLMSSMHNWIVLAYPKSLERTALRQHSRIHVNVMAELCTEDNQFICSIGHISDISIKGGAFIGTYLGKDAIETPLFLRITDYKSGEPLFLPVTIKNEHVIDAEHKLNQYGLVLDCSQPEAEVLVQKVILKHLNQEMSAKAANELNSAHPNLQADNNIGIIDDATRKKSF